MLENFSGVNSEGLYLGSEKENENCRLVFTYSVKRETRWFHVVVVQERQRKCTKKRDARAKLLFCAFAPFSLPSTSSLLKLPKRRAGRAPPIF